MSSRVMMMLIFKDFIQCPERLLRSIQVAFDVPQVFLFKEAVCSTHKCF